MAQRIKDGVVILEDELDMEHLSPSKIGMLKRCEAQYWYRYIKGLKVPPSSVLALGSAYDDALTAGYMYKIDKKEDMDTDDVVSAFLTSFDVRKNEAEFELGETQEEVRDEGIKLVKEYQNKIAPLINPKEVQKYYNVSFPGVNWTLKGIADVVEVDDTIRDNKTTSKSPSKNAEGEYEPFSDDHRFQMLCYSISEKMQKGEQAGNNLWLDYNVKNKKPKIIQVKLPTPTESDFKYFQSLTSIVIKKMELIKDGVLPPLPNRGNMMCSKRYCGYWMKCERDYGGRVKD